MPKIWVKDNCGELVKRLRKEQKLTGEELAKKVGVVRTYISKIEKHNLLPSIAVVRKLAEVLHSNLIVQQYYSEKFKDIERQYYKTKFKGISKTKYVSKANTPEGDELFTAIENYVFNEEIESHRDFVIALLKEFKPSEANNEKIIKEMVSVITSARELYKSSYDKCFWGTETIIKKLKL